MHRLFTTVADIGSEPADDSPTDAHYLIVLLLAVGAVVLGFKNIKAMVTNEEKLRPWFRVVVGVCAVVFIALGVLVLKWFAHAGLSASR